MRAAARAANVIDFRSMLAEKPKPVAKSAGRKRPVKYTDGTNTWAGGGSMPLWLREKISAGATLDSFLVQKAA